MPQHLKATPEALLTHLGWVRALAGQLVRDQATAEDLAQETWVRALQNPPKRAASMRAFLATILRNLARQWARSERSRQHREKIQNRGEQTPSTAEVVAQSNQQRQLVDAVFELEEPYRSTILLRFFENLPPREIARRMEVPVSTVKTRMSRALDRLRRRLDTAYGNRRAWLMSLLPLAARAPAPVATTVVGVGLMKAVTLTTVGILLLVGTLAAFFFTGAPGSEAEQVSLTSPQPRGQSTPAADASGIAPGVPSADLQRTSVPIPVADEPAAEPPPFWNVRGQVLDASARPLSGFPVLARASGETVDSDEAGWFEMEVSRPHMQFVGAREGWVTLGKGLFREGTTIEPLVVVAPDQHLAGRVIDDRARPLPGADIRYVLPRNFLSRFNRPLAQSQTVEWSGRSAERGAFELAEIPAIAGAEIWVFLEGYVPVSMPLPDTDREDLEITLVRPAETAAGTLRGRVITADGRPGAGARVVAGLTTGVADEGGEFTLDLSRAVTVHEVVAVLPGHLPGVHTLRRPPSRERPPEFIELVLGGAPLSITGRVRNENGEPLAGIQVWVEDPSLLGSLGLTPFSTEGLLSGAAISTQLGGVQAQPPRDGNLQWNRARAMSAPTPTFSWTTTDAEGRFLVPGLLPRSYTMKAFDPETLLWTTQPDVLAGRSDVELELSQTALWPELTGRVVDQQGNPVPGVSLWQFHEAFKQSSRVYGGTMNFTTWRMGTEIVTGEDGTFRFTNVPREGVVLWVRNDNILPLQEHLSPSLDPTDLEIRVQRRLYFRIELTDPSWADTVGALDAAGNPSPLFDMRPNNNDQRRFFPIEDGKSRALSVGAEAATLIFLLDDVEVGRQPLHLVPGEIIVIRR